MYARALSSQRKADRALTRVRADAFSLGFFLP
jgi:hypothetical protein